MALEESDFARIQKITEDAAELATLRAMKEHLKESHEPIWDRIGQEATKADTKISAVESRLTVVDGDVKIYKGVGIALAFFVTFIEAMGAWVHHGGNKP